MIARTITPLEALNRVAAQFVPPTAKTPAPTPDGNPQPRLDVPRWLIANAVEFSTKDDGGKLVFAIDCPFNHEHAGEANICQFPSGAVSASCFHDSCKGKGWKDFKTAIGEPDSNHYSPPLRKKADAKLDLRNTESDAPNRTEEDFEITAMTAAELDDGHFPLTYLIENVLVEGQPCVVAAPKKSLKTNTMIDLTLSIASGSKFLGEFYVPEPRRVVLISGESGQATIQETARRIAKSKPWMNLRDYERAMFGFKLPKLADFRALEALRRFITKYSIEVLIVDPAYLALDVGDGASNVFTMGAQLQPISDIAADLSVTPIIVHHFRKGSSVTDGPPELEDITYAGFTEWARQWLLMSRRSHYCADNPGHHELWFAAGGSAGHSVAKAVDIDEGARNDYGGRKWDVRCTSIGAAVREDIDAKETAKKQRQEQQHAASVEKSVAKVLEALRCNPDGLSARRFKEEHGIRPMLLMAAIRKLTDDKRVVACEIIAGNGRSYDGWKLDSNSAGTSGNNREQSQSIPLVPSETPVGTGTAPLL